MTESVDDLSGDEIVAQQDVDSVISAGRNVKPHSRFCRSLLAALSLV